MNTSIFVNTESALYSPNEGEISQFAAKNNELYQLNAFKKELALLKEMHFATHITYRTRDLNQSHLMLRRDRFTAILVKSL